MYRLGRRMLTALLLSSVTTWRLAWSTSDVAQIYWEQAQHRFDGALRAAGRSDLVLANMEIDWRSAILAGMDPLDAMEVVAALTRCRYLRSDQMSEAADMFPTLSFGLGFTATDTARLLVDTLNGDEFATGIMQDRVRLFAAFQDQRRVKLMFISGRAADASTEILGRLHARFYRQ